MTPSRKELETLMARMARNDGAAVMALYDLTAPRLFAMCLRILKDHSGAEAALQEAFHRIAREAQSGAEGPLEPWVWITSVVRNAAIDRLRTENSGDAPEADPADGVALLKVVYAEGLDYRAIAQRNGSDVAGARKRVQAVLTEFEDSVTHG
ncbi:sigma factor [Palleronia caenipelagi]|uniref:RNA polymerase sigma-70 region 2 domain-containing protein n=1 Tax=Palleronia caenipelagi TaxID=2489174 RepID=A0A547Q015_9RHOB|nr:sigma factor [Palleronia caenipelagi]TRD19732.1 hypothetical protein FEV53_10535 [Palleronia caenipelagi]